MDIAHGRQHDREEHRGIAVESAPQSTHVGVAVALPPLNLRRVRGGSATATPNKAVLPNQPQNQRPPLSRLCPLVTLRCLSSPAVLLAAAGPLSAEEAPGASRGRRWTRLMREKERCDTTPWTARSWAATAPASTTGRCIAAPAPKASFWRAIGRWSACWPNRWMAALLRGHRSRRPRQMVSRILPGRVALPLRAHDLADRGHRPARGGRNHRSRAATDGAGVALRLGAAGCKLTTSWCGPSRRAKRDGTRGGVGTRSGGETPTS